MKPHTALLTCLALCVGGPAASAEESAWGAYLDFAYVYSSADPAALEARLEEYAREAGGTLERYLAQELEDIEAEASEFDERRVRRRAIAYLLRYLAGGEPRDLEASVEAVRELEGRLGRHENRYWYHYVLAHRALETGHRFDFVGEMLDLWLGVVVPLEAPYESLRALSLSDSPNSGFVGALPYVYENVARMILLRSQKMGLDRDLDPLGALVRLLHDGRVGAHPDVIPREASSRDYLDRIVSRLDGPDSDGGSLTFTLALFEASARHDHARALLAGEGFSDAALEALRLTDAAYETARDRAATLPGQAAVYARVLRQLGEVYAAKRRLGVDPALESSFSIEGAIEVYADLHRMARREGWEVLGFETREAYLEGMHRLWEEIQEASLNAADYYLARSLAEPHRADRNARHAARAFARYLGFFYEFAAEEGHEAVPESAYFAGYEAARGFGDAYFGYARGTPTRSEIELATRRYLSALSLFPFDPTLWSAITAALERQGRESEYLQLVRPVAESVTGSRQLNQWIEQQEPDAEVVGTLRRVLAEGSALMYLGFAGDLGPEGLERDLAELRARREQLEAELGELAAPAAPGDARWGGSDIGPEGERPDAPVPDLLSARAREARHRSLREKAARLEQLEARLAAGSRAVPLFRAALQSGDLAQALRARRDHPLHTLLRRMYQERRARPAANAAWGG